MNYIYDITVNFNNVFYDFFEWNSNDNLLHIRKIPIFKIDNNSFYDIIDNTIVIDKELLESIKNKTEIYGKKKYNITSCLFCNDNNIVALEFDNEGKSKNISCISIEEELDILETVILKNSLISYRILEKRKIFNTTRRERKNISFIKKQINSLNLEKDADKIKYLYFEYFNEPSHNTKDALHKLKKYIESNQINDNIKYFLHLSSNKN